LGGDNDERIVWVHRAGQRPVLRQALGAAEHHGQHQSGTHFPTAQHVSVVAAAVSVRPAAEGETEHPIDKPVGAQNGEIFVQLQAFRVGENILIGPACLGTQQCLHRGRLKRVPQRHGMAGCVVWADARAGAAVMQMQLVGAGGQIADGGVERAVAVAEAGLEQIGAEFVRHILAQDAVFQADLDVANGGTVPIHGPAFGHTVGRDEVQLGQNWSGGFQVAFIQHAAAIWRRHRPRGKLPACGGAPHLTDSRCNRPVREAIDFNP
jgi:hypothetical protein